MNMDSEEVGGLWETGFYEIRRPISEVFESLNVVITGVLTVRCSSQGAVLLAVCRRSMVIDGVASGVKRLSGGVTSSRRG
ncbi:hypothetical protein TNCV_808501 [Trichonephila clavipes]|nr:hypothetical protein TNCV_808501 [Trichonephila clavipes]